MQKIAVTGTKGKTTVVYAVAAVLQTLNLHVLRVDTTGHYLDGLQKSTLEDSKAIWNLVPTVSPGRYLWEFKDDPDNAGNVAVLECALGSSGPAGLGYRNHDVGVFLNVFEDHLGSSPRLKTRADIAKAKSFVFSRLEPGGWAVFNADDALVCQTLSCLPKDAGVNLIPCGLNFSHFALADHLAVGGLAISVEETNIVLLSKDGSQVVCDLKAIPWAFNGHYQPSVWNLLHVVGALVAYYKGQVPARLRTAIEAVRLGEYSGRLTQLRAANGATIIADYAHEKISLSEVGKLAQSLKGPGGKVIGVVRLAYDRTDSLIKETGHYIAQDFDQFIVYDKIDGYWRQPKKLRSKQFVQEIGKISRLFAEALREKNPHVEQILREDEAVERAAAIAQPEDVVVMIVNDDIERSVGFIKQSFKAELV